MKWRVSWRHKYPFNWCIPPGKSRYLITRRLFIPFRLFRSPHDVFIAFHWYRFHISHEIDSLSLPLPEQCARIRGGPKCALSGVTPRGQVNSITWTLVSLFLFILLLSSAHHTRQQWNKERHEWGREREWDVWDVWEEKKCRMRERV